MRSTVVKFGMIAGAALFAMPAGAATITAGNGFGQGGGFSSCKDVNLSTPFSTGTLVSGGNWTGGCVGFYQVDLNTVAKTLTLKGLEVGNYETAFLDLAGITGVTITGVSSLGPNNVFDPNAYGGSFATDVPTPAITFSGNSIHIDWTSIGSPSGQFAFSGTGGQSVFAYSVAGVPEPAAWALMLAGFGLTGAAMRRRSKVRVTYA